MQDPDSESHTVISIHAPTRGATYDCSFGVEQASISIHAPTRGATSISNPTFILTVISIHAPTRGATIHIFIKIFTLIFQSTLLQEERPYTFLDFTIFHIISIHAPTRGATLYRCATLCIIFYFNPRSYKRSDQPSA